jgi:hypothetical protein
MRTPVRLAATLLKSQIKQTARGKSGASPIYRWNLRFGEERLMAVSDYPNVEGKHRTRDLTKERAVQNAKALRAAPWASYPILWLTGPVDIMGHSATPGLARWLQDSRRIVFVESDGVQLRQRIHSFRPDSRLYLTIRLYGMAERHDGRMQTRGAFAQAMESIRAAQLSGFFVCVHVVMEAATELGETTLLLEHLETMDLDGVIVTAAESSGSADGQVKSQAAHKLIGNSWWEKFSHLVQLALNAPEPSAKFAESEYAERQTPSKSEINISHNAAVPGEEAVAQ